ncbi:MAG TPA: hypothetical protein EYO62_06425 [Aquificales bacterium]|nr:hypothetical protein [Aquificales bacterium]
MNEIISVLDIGSGWIKGLATEVKDLETLELDYINNVKVESKGIEKGNIIRTSAARASIKEAIKKLSDLTSQDLRSFYLLLNHPKIKFENLNVGIDLLEKGEETEDILPQVEEEHLEQLKTLVKERAKEKGYEIIHIIPRYFVLDGEKNYEPVGLYATRIEGYYHVIKVKRQVILNLKNLIQSLGYEAKKIMFPAYVASFDVLNEDDSKKRILILDLGHTTSGFCYFIEKTPYVSGALDIGLRDIIEAFSLNYKISLKEAQKIFQEIGYYKPQAFSTETEEETVQTFRDDGTPITINKSEIGLVLKEGITQILIDVLNKLGEEGVDLVNELDEIVLIGGGANLKNIKELVEELLAEDLNVAIRLGMQKDFSHYEDIDIGQLSNLDNEFAAARGAVILASRALQKGFWNEPESSNPFELEKTTNPILDEELETLIPTNEEQEKKGFFTKFLSFFKNLLSED